MLKFIFLGAIQGLTEFIPISSSGHLVVFQHLMNINKDVVFLDTFLHLGTILALITFFFKDILRAVKNIRLIGYIALATAITGMIGLTFKDIFEPMFNDIRSTAVFFLVNGLILLSTKFAKSKQKAITALDSAIMGTAQGISIIPSISRSGITMASLLLRGVGREDAFKFSFIASIPAVLGAFLFEAKDIIWSETYDLSAIVTGVFVSYVFGLVALKFLSTIIKMNKFYVFGYYCLILGLALLVFL